MKSDFKLVLVLGLVASGLCGFTSAAGNQDSCSVSSIDKTELERTRNFCQFYGYDKNLKPFVQSIQSCVCKLVGEDLYGQSLLFRNGKDLNDLIQEVTGVSYYTAVGTDAEFWKGYEQYVANHDGEFMKPEEAAAIDAKLNRAISMKVPEDESPDEVAESIQMALTHSLSSLKDLQERKVTINFPQAGSQSTPAHSHTDFEFTTFAPSVFKDIRALIGVDDNELIESISGGPLKAFGALGGSGSAFYLTSDNQYFIKYLSLEHQESKKLIEILPKYFNALKENSWTLLPKFLGHYDYISPLGHMVLVIMPNLFPANVELHEKYDLKGSTRGREASESDLAKRSPTLKDLDFMRKHEQGFTINPHLYDALVKLFERDIQLLRDSNIMDYSFLLGVHNLDSEESAQIKSSHVAKRGHYGAIPAVNEKGERVLLFLGIIDTLVNYSLDKVWKHFKHHMGGYGETTSTTNPKFYRERWFNFMTKRVLRRWTPSKINILPSARGD